MKEQPLLHLSLNPDEIDTLLTVLALVGGDPADTRRRHVDSIINKLNIHGFRQYSTNDVSETKNGIEFIQLVFPQPKHGVGRLLRVIDENSDYHGKVGYVVEVITQTTVKNCPLDEPIYILKFSDNKSTLAKTKLVAFPESDLS